MTSKNIKEIFQTDVRSFSVYDCQRSIPSGIDGLKPAMRKIVYGMLKKFPTQEVKVSIAASGIQECIPGYTNISIAVDEYSTINALYEKYLDSSFKIISYNTDTKEIESDNAKILYKGKTDVLMCIELDDGNTFYCTPEHRVLTSNGWKHASSLTDMDEIISLK